MGFFDFLKETFSKGGIKVRLAVPKNFVWGDEAIVSTVTLTGHKTEPRTVTSLIFELEDELEEEKHKDQNQSHTQFGTRVRVFWEREGTIELAPGQTVTLEVPFVVAPEQEQEAVATAEEALEGTKLGRFVGAAGRLGIKFGMVTDPSHIRDYRVTVQAPVDGANKAARHSRPIQQGSGWRMNTTLRL